MDLKNVSKLTGSLSGPALNTPRGRQIAGRALAAPSVELPRGDQVEVSNDRRPAPPLRTDLRSRANDLISIGNIASEATGEIEKLVTSIDGILEQVQSKELPEGRRFVLQNEARDLVNEIKRRATTQTSEGLRPLAGDKIRLEVEEKLGRTLEFLLPRGAEEAFGLGQINFTTKDAIINTVTTIEAARQRLKELRGAVDTTLDTIKSTVGELDVAIQNSEASQTSLRDVDDALRLAGRTKSVISENPQSALGSFGKLNPRALDLLE